MISPEDRLIAAQRELVKRDVIDVKFFFSRAARGTPSKAHEGAAIVLEAFLDGDYVVAEEYKQKPKSAYSVSAD